MRFLNIIFALGIWASASFLNLEASQGPNIILIIADDLAWDDSRPYGHPTIRTPNLTRMADTGMRFDRAFLTISSCSASRSSLITCKYPHRTDAEQLHWPLPGNQVTFVELLKETGYWTAAAGKWHLGNEVKDRFDRIWEVDTSGFQLPSGKAAEFGEFKETAIGDAKSGCADWLTALNSRPKDQPFFLWLAALDPHRPYDEGILKKPHSVDDVRLPPYIPDTLEVRNDMALYYDEATRLDRFVGEVMDAVEDQGIAENTLIVFISDNGRPFPRDKTTLYESGIRTPMFAVWKNTIAPQSICKELVSSIDLGAGFLELAGVQPASGMDGKSFAPLLTAPRKSIRDYCFAEKHWHDYEDHSRAVRSHRYKYILNDYHDLPMTPPADAVRGPVFQAMLKMYQADKLKPNQQQCLALPRPQEELYDLIKDPYELYNLAHHDAYKTVLDKHRDVLQSWRLVTNDKIPTVRTPDEFDRETGGVTPARIRPRPSKAEMTKTVLKE
jgi:N-sulfoglucosamine sulfohydrolase